MNEIDLKNEAGAPKTSQSSDVSNINSQLAHINGSLLLQEEKLMKLNSTVVKVVQNSTVMIDWVKQDVVALQVFKSYNKHSYPYLPRARCLSCKMTIRT